MPDGTSESTKAPNAVIAATQKALQEKYSQIEALEEPVREASIKVREAEHALQRAQDYLSSLQKQETTLKEQYQEMSEFLKSNNQGYWLKDFEAAQRRRRERGY